MKLLATHCVRFAVLLSLLALAACVSTDSPPDVTVAADRPPAGAKFRPPTEKNPYYYYLVSIGAQEWGPAVAGDAPPPPREEVEPHIVQTLEAQHYIRATTETPSPSLVIGYAWGSVNVDEIDFGEVDEEGNPIAPTQLNRKQMLALVTTRHTDTSPNSIDMSLSVPDLDEGRHFLLIAAYDITHFPKKDENEDLNAGGRSDKQKAKKKRPKPIWRMKLSTPNRSTSLAEAIPALLESGGAFIGQDQHLPETLTGKLKEGKVSIGELIIVPDDKDTAPKPEQTPTGENGSEPQQQTPKEE